MDDNAAFRASIRALLDPKPDLVVLGEAGDGITAIRLIGELRPNVVIMDVVIPKQSGIEATRQICETYPNVKVLGLSMHADSHFVAAMRTAGASGYVLKDQVFDELAPAIRIVGGGHTYFRQIGPAGVIRRNIAFRDPATPPNGRFLHKSWR